MRAPGAILRSVAALVCAAAILVAPARAQVGETFRLEAGHGLPHCEEVRASPLCQVERSLAFKLPQPEPRETPLVGRLIDWFLGYEGKGGTDIRRPERDSVVAPVIIDYRVDAQETLDAEDIEALPDGWRESLGPDALEPGVVRITISVAFEDAHGMRWPVEGWLSHVYLLRERGDLPVRQMEEVGSSREIAVRWARSGCIGSAETPLCAVETFLACRIRRDDALCRDVDETVGRGVRWATSVSYYVAAIDAVADNRRPPGNTYAVTLEEWDLYRRRGSGNEEFVRYLVVRAEDGWRVVGRSVVDWELPQDPG